MVLISDCPDTVADANCQMENNHASCSFDGGDCCVSFYKLMNLDWVICATTGVITSTGFPSDYTNNYDISWLVQVPSQELIEITFITFDVEDHASCG